MILKTREIRNSLTSKGFEEIPKRDHIRFRFIYEGRKTQYTTFFSHGHREIGDQLISLMARQLGLSKLQFVDLVVCTISEEGLIEIYLSQGM